MRANRWPSLCVCNMYMCVCVCLYVSMRSFGRPKEPSFLQIHVFMCIYIYIYIYNMYTLVCVPLEDQSHIRHFKRAQVHFCKGKSLCIWWYFVSLRFQITKIHMHIHKFKTACILHVLAVFFGHNFDCFLKYFDFWNIIQYVCIVLKLFFLA